MLTNILLVIATFFVGFATYQSYKATKAITLLQHKPVVIAWLREPKKGRGIYVQSVGNGTAFNGNVSCKTNSGSVNYPFTRMWVGQVYEYPIEGQPALPIGANDKTLTIELTYEDIDGNPYRNEISTDLSSQVELGQV
jgi:hypothetical protein